MVAERGVWPPQEQIPEKICEQIADVPCATGCRADYRSAQDGGADTRCPRAGDGRAVGENCRRPYPWTESKSGPRSRP